MTVTPCIIYARFSSAQQERGSSIDRQLELARAHIAREGWTEIEVVEDHGRSAWKGDHLTKGNLGLLTKRVMSGEFEPGTIILVEKLDRLSRQDRRITRRWLEDVTDLGIGVATVDGGRLYTAKTLQANMTEDIEILIRAELAWKESQQKSERIMHAQAKNRAKAATTGRVMSARCPGWLRVENGAFVKDEARVALVQQIFQWTADGVGARTIAKRLNDASVETWGKARDGWEPTYISEIINSPAVEGDHQPRRLVDGVKVTFNGLRPFRMHLANGNMEMQSTLTTYSQFHAYGDTHLPSYTRLWDRGETGYTVLEYRRQASGGVVGAHTFASGSNDNTNYTVSVFKNGNTNDRSDLILDYNGGFSWRGKSVWTGHNFDPNGKVSWTDTNMDGGAYTVVRRNGDGGGFFTGRLHAYSQTATTDVWNSGIEIQEVKNVGNTKGSHDYAPALTFHWKNVAARSIYMNSGGWICFGAQGDKEALLAGIKTNAIGTTNNSELHLKWNEATKLRTHANGVAVSGNCDVENGGIFIRSNAPTITFQDSDERSAMIHVNGNWMYFLRGAGTNSTGWEAMNGAWPLQLNLDNNDAHFGGSVYAGTNRWFRVRQNNDGTQAGIYWETWGGGWFMQDASWMRVYQDKNVVTGGAIQMGSFTVTSDRRLKTDIVPIPLAQASEIIDATNVYEFTKGGRRMFGMIAQEAREVAPILVSEGADMHEDGDAILSLDQTGYIPVLIAEVRSLRQRVARLEGVVQ